MKNIFLGLVLVFSLNAMEELGSMQFSEEELKGIDAKLKPASPKGKQSFNMKQNNLGNPDLSRMTPKESMPSAGMAKLLGDLAYLEELKRQTEGYFPLITSIMQSPYLSKFIVFAGRFLQSTNPNLHSSNEGRVEEVVEATGVPFSPTIESSIANLVPEEHKNNYNTAKRIYFQVAQSPHAKKAAYVFGIISMLYTVKKTYDMCKTLYSLSKDALVLGMLLGGVGSAYYIGKEVHDRYKIHGGIKPWLAYLYYGSM